VKNCYLGIDVGSVSTNVVLMDENKEVMGKVYTRTGGTTMSTPRSSNNTFVATY